MSDHVINLRSSESKLRFLDFDLGITFPPHPNFIRAPGRTILASRGSIWGLLVKIGVLFGDFVILTKFEN